MTLTVTIQKPTSDDLQSHSVELPAELFDVDTNVSLIHQVVVAQLAAARQGTHSTKRRGEVRGGGKKPYRQKGTGRARQGSTRAPQFVGGGVVHGPKPRDYSQRTPKKMIAAALRQSLSDRARNGRVHVVDSLLENDVPSTRGASAALASVSSAKHVLLVTAREDAATWKSLRNVETVHLLEPGQLNTYDVLISDDVVFTQDALQQFVEARLDGATLTLTEVTLEPKAKPNLTKAVKTEKPAKAKKAAALVEPPVVADDVIEAADIDADGPDYGPDSHLPLEDGSPPEGFPIKGNADSMLYHVPDSAFYDRTIAEVWFATAEAAEAAGFELPPSQRDSAGDADSEADSAEETEEDA